MARRKSSVSIRRNSELCPDGNLEEAYVELNTIAPQKNVSRFSYHLSPLDDAFRFDPTLQGPLKGRSCTDIYILIVLIIILIGWGLIAGFAFTKGNFHRFQMTENDDGAFCGTVGPFVDKPFIYRFDFFDNLHPKAFSGFQKTKVLCLKECPNHTFYYDLHKNSTITNDIGQMYCTGMHDFSYFRNYSEYEKFVGNKTCSKYSLKSLDPELTYNNCFPDILGSELIDFIEIYTDRFGMSGLMKMSKVHILSTLNVKKSLTIKDGLEKYPLIITMVLFSVIGYFLLTFIMKRIAKFTIIIFVVSIITVLGIAAYFSYAFHKNIHNAQTEKVNEYLQKHEYFRKFTDINEIYLYFLIGTSAMLIVFLLLLLFLKNQIKLAIGIIEETSHAILEIKSTIIFPFLIKFLEIATLIFFIFIGMYLTSISDKTTVLSGLDDNSNCKCHNGDTCNTETFRSDCAELNEKCNLSIYNEMAKCDKDHRYSAGLLQFIQIFNVFAYLFTSIYLSSFGEMVIASTFATWYYTFHKSDVPVFVLMKGLKRTLTFHAGTIAFGVIFLSIFEYSRYSVSFFDRVSIQYGNIFGIFYYINSYTLIMCAIYGKGFIESGMHVFELIYKNILRFTICTGITRCLFIMVNFGLAAIAASISYLILQIPVLRTDYSMIPVIIVFILSYAFGSIYFDVYTIAADTIMLCYIEDTETNDGTFESPFFMSDNLMDLSDRRNMVPRIRYDHHV